MLALHPARPAWGVLFFAKNDLTEERRLLARPGLRPLCAVWHLKPLKNGPFTRSCRFDELKVPSPSRDTPISSFARSRPGSWTMKEKTEPDRVWLRVVL